MIVCLFILQLITEVITFVHFVDDNILSQCQKASVLCQVRWLLSLPLPLPLPLPTTFEIQARGRRRAPGEEMETLRQ